ncbi:MAG: hypothetical protein M3505_04720 [Verrucomicrobiota bacterium]|nr:hypothetical protein [Chthoniobacterales bacterium]MDQ3313920.1 hypothetical protein [Verrucomicrobiota bacterium]
MAPIGPRKIRNPLAPGWEAVRANLIPAFLIQTVMLALFASYYVSPEVAETLNRLAAYKATHGLVFVVTATVLAASILPEFFLVLLFQKGRVRAQNFRNIVFTAPLWGFDGITVDFLYRSLAALLGDRATLPVVAAKICIDQFGYNVFFAAPYGVLAYQWKNSGFGSGELRRNLTWAFYRDKIVPTLFTTWAVWIPLMAIIYSLPLALQFPLFSLALTFWVLLLTYMTNRFAGKNGRPAAVVPGEIAPGLAR